MTGEAVLTTVGGFFIALLIGVVAFLGKRGLDSLQGDLDRKHEENRKFYTEFLSLARKVERHDVTLFGAQGDNGMNQKLKDLDEDKISEHRVRGIIQSYMGELDREARQRLKDNP